jgi:FkbM family methyltransferase
MWFIRLIDAVDYLYRIYMRLCGLVKPQRIGETYFGCKFNCDIRDFIQRRIYFLNIYEPNLTYYMSGRVAPGSAVLDVGANIGYISLLASHLVGPRGTVHAIEAAPKTFGKLTANLRLNQVRNVEAFNLAATGEPCMVEIVEGDSRNIGTNAIRKAGAPTSSSIAGKPITDIVGPSIGKIGFIKIDIEGSEGPVLDDILTNLDAFSGLHTVVSELGSNSAVFFARFQKAGFSAYAIPNNYRIGATLVRRYLDRSREGDFITRIPVAAYDSAFTDYAFERSVDARVQPAAVVEMA